MWSLTVGLELIKPSELTFWTQEQVIFWEKILEIFPHLDQTVVVVGQHTSLGNAPRHSDRYNCELKLSSARNISRVVQYLS
jgi:hypothetical protein